MTKANKKQKDKTKQVQEDLETTEGKQQIDVLDATKNCDAGTIQESISSEENNNSIIDDLDILALKQELEETQNKLEQTQKDLKEKISQALTARADANNIQKRAERDVENAHKYALDKFVPELLKVKDSLEMGTKAAKEARDTNLDNFIEGSDLAIKMFADTLAKFKVEEVKSEGEKLNPEHHQALTTIDSDEYKTNTIVDVVQKGYTLNGRLLRPAMVIVAK